MAKDAGAHLERQAALRICQELGADQVCTGVDQQEQSEAKRQNQQQLRVVLGDRVVDDDLHVKRAGEHVELQDGRENERLDQNRHQTRHLADKIEQRQLGG